MLMLYSDSEALYDLSSCGIGSFPTIDKSEVPYEAEILGIHFNFFARHTNDAGNSIFRESRSNEISQY